MFLLFSPVNHQGRWSFGISAISAICTYPLQRLADNPPAPAIPPPASPPPAAAAAPAISPVPAPPADEVRSVVLVIMVLVVVFVIPVVVVVIVFLILVVYIVVVIVDYMFSQLFLFFSLCEYYNTLYRNLPFFAVVSHVV